MRIERIAAIVGIVVGIPSLIVALFAISDNWGKIETAAEAIYPLPLLLVLVLVTVGFAGLFANERRRKPPVEPPIANLEISREPEGLGTEQKAEARQAVTLIRNEVASNRRLAVAAIGRGGMSLRRSNEAWVAYKGFLARLPDTSEPLAVAQEAYDAFEHLDALDIGAGYSNIADDEFNAAIEKAERAEASLNNLASWIEGTRSRWQIGGMFESDD